MHGIGSAAASAGGDVSLGTAFLRRGCRGGLAHDVAVSIMESPCGELSESRQGENAASQLQNSGGHFHSKRHKELENAALQTSLNSLRTEMEAMAFSDNEGSRTDEEGLPAAVQSSAEPSDLSPAVSPRPESESETKEQKGREEERTLTDHLNKRLLSHFLEKLNQSDLTLPGVQQLDCAVAGEEDSNRAVDEW